MTNTKKVWSKSNIKVFKYAFNFKVSNININKNSFLFNNNILINDYDYYGDGFDIYFSLRFFSSLSSNLIDFVHDFVCRYVD